MTTVTVTLPPALAAFADEALARGAYADHDELLTDALRLLRETETDGALRRALFLVALEAGLAQGTRDGQPVESNVAVFPKRARHAGR